MTISLKKSNVGYAVPSLQRGSQPDGREASPDTGELAVRWTLVILEAHGAK